EDPAFLELVRTVSKRNNLQLVTGNTVKSDILALASVCTERLISLITVDVPQQLSVQKLRVHLTANGKKMKHAAIRAGFFVEKVRHKPRSEKNCENPIYPIFFVLRNPIPNISQKRSILRPLIR